MDSVDEMSIVKHWRVEPSEKIMQNGPCGFVKTEADSGSNLHLVKCLKNLHLTDYFKTLSEIVYIINRCYEKILFCCKFPNISFSQSIF